MCMTPVEISAAVKDLKELKTLQDRIAAKIKAIENQLKEHMGDTSEFTLSGDNYHITWNIVSSTRIDTTALKRDLPDIAAQYTKTSETRRFIVT